MTLWRRYSEFHDMHVNLMSGFAGQKEALKHVPQPPPKTWSPVSTTTNKQWIEQRRQGLEDYLKALLRAPRARASRNPYFLDFLGLMPTMFSVDETATPRPVVAVPVQAGRVDTNTRKVIPHGRKTNEAHLASLHKHYRSGPELSADKRCLMEDDDDGAARVEPAAEAESAAREYTVGASNHDGRLQPEPVPASLSNSVKNNVETVEGLND